MRYLVFSLGLIGGVALAACGDAGPTTPPAGTVASVTAFAGTGQSVVPGEDTPVAPAVIVRDKQGLPVAGASVQFSVTAGGGSLGGATPVSGSDGVARVTRWTVGTAGPQQVTAKVGTLTPVLFEATLNQASTTIVKAVPASGGVVAITTSGHPYQGLTLTIPPGTFPSTATWTLRVRTDLTLPTLPVGYRVGGPILEITTDALRGGALMTLDVPIQRPAGEGLVLAFYDPARRVMEVLPTVAQTDNSTRVITKHLRADLLMGQSLPGLWAGSAGGGPIGALVPIAFSLPQPAVANVAINPWPVVDYGSVAQPTGFGAAIPALQVAAAAANVATSNVVKPLSTPGFYADAGILGAVQDVASSPGISAQDLTGLAAQFAATPKAQRDDLIQQNIAASLALTRKPTLAVLFPISSGPTPSGTVYANPIGATLGGITAVLPTQSANGTLGKVASGFQSMPAKVVGDGPSTAVDAALPLPSFVFNYSKPSSAMQVIKQYQGTTPAQRKALNDQLSATFNMQRPALEVESVPGGGWLSSVAGALQVVRGDDLKIRVAGGGTLAMYNSESGQVFGSPSGIISAAEALIGPQGAPPEAFTVLSSLVEAIGGGGLVTRRQHVPFDQEFRRSKFRVNPDTAQITTDSTTARFDATVADPPGGGFRITYDWGDGTTSDHQNTTTTTHKYATTGNYTVIIRLRSADGTVELANTYAYVRSGMSPHWRLTSMENADTLDLNVPLPIAVILQQAIASPSSAMISVDDIGLGITTMTLRINLTGPWTENNCCAPLAPTSNELRASLGTTPNVGTAATYFAFEGYTESRWSQTTTDLGAGSMDGQYPNGSFSYEFRPPLGPAEPSIFKSGPEYVLRVTATRSGTAMSGVITFIYWSFEDALPTEPHGYFDTFTTSYSFPFTAVRIK